MKGAIAEPWVRTTRPPNTAIITRIGSSQNFFRTFRKRQSSPKKDRVKLFARGLSGQIRTEKFFAPVSNCL